jgi:hypothetical protein
METPSRGAPTREEWTRDDQPARLDLRRRAFARQPGHAAPHFNDNLSLSFWRIRDGYGPPLRRPSRQRAVRRSSRRSTSASDRTARVLKPGDLYYAPKDLPHGDSRFVGDPAHGEVWIMDMFSPVREEYRNG